VTEPDLTPRSLDERYLLVEQLATDPTHESWRGFDDLAGRPVIATIYLAVATDDEWRDRFDQAARRLEVLSHPGLASTLAHDARDIQPWLVTSAVDGDLVDEILVEDGGLSPDDAMAIVGQTAIAVKTAHDTGIAHGSIDGQHIVVRPDGSSALVGFELPTTRRAADDLTALAALAHRLLPDPASAGDERIAGDVVGFLRWVGSAAATDAGEIGRTALALAASIRGAHTTSVTPAPNRAPSASVEAPVEATEPTDEPRGPRRPWYDEAERKRVRNGLIAIGTIVVVFGAALLWLIDRGGSGNTATVPSVVGERLSEAQYQITQDALRDTENITDGSAYVTGQSPVAGTVVKYGTLITLTISESGP
jgi:serine/threonine protein kinase